MRLSLALVCGVMAKKFAPVAQCASDMAAMKLSSSGCRQFVAGSEKAKLQWKLEEEFRGFERGW